MQTNSSADLSIGSDVPSNSWLKEATHIAMEMAKEEGVNWKNFEAIIFLPERGRCYVKRKGCVTMSAHG